VSYGTDDRDSVLTAKHTTKVHRSLSLSFRSRDIPADLRVGGKEVMSLNIPEFTILQYIIYRSKFWPCLRPWSVVFGLGLTGSHTPALHR